MQCYQKLRKRRLVYSYQIQWFYTLQLEALKQYLNTY